MTPPAHHAARRRRDRLRPRRAIGHAAVDRHERQLRAVLGVVRAHADADGRCDLRRRTIATLAGMDLATTGKRIADLVQAGAIRRIVDVNGVTTALDVQVTSP